MMRALDIVRAWGRILTGRRPSLSIEITRECPLRCPGCYAYEPNHLGGEVTLRGLSDHQGQQLVDGVVDLVERYRPLHVSIVGGDPLVRYRELTVLLPLLARRGLHVQLVTSAFRRLDTAWAGLPRLSIAVSVDGLPLEHDVRRAPATYDRILKNVEGHRVTIHCTITAQMMKRPGYLDEFLAFWTPLPETRRIWFSMFTPQRGDDLPEMLTAEERGRAIAELLDLRKRYTKLEMGPATIRQFARPPSSPRECLFAQTTQCVSADLKTVIEPCQFGGDPDCGSCGCLASVGLAAVAGHRLAGVVPLGAIFRASVRAGQAMASAKAPTPPPSELRVLR
jgi:MoaA/NifB/PqqE/SkfB family radical SAM enzyme